MGSFAFIEGRDSVMLEAKFCLV